MLNTDSRCLRHMASTRSFMLALSREKYSSPSRLRPTTYQLLSHLLLRASFNIMATRTLVVRYYQPLLCSIELSKNHIMIKKKLPLT